MHLLEQRTLGIILLLLLGLLVLIKQLATGSIMKDTPKGGILIWLTHIFNYFFLLFVNPVAAILLLTGHVETLDPTHLTVNTPGLLKVLEIGGMVLYAVGLFLMGWALLTLRRNYQVGGSAPRVSDAMVLDGPYRLMRHPMYSAALCIALGLACFIQSLACFLAFCIYLVLIILLIPVEEEGLRQAYGERYMAYRQKVASLVPFLR